MQSSNWEDKLECYSDCLIVGVELMPFQGANPNVRFLASRFLLLMADFVEKLGGGASSIVQGSAQENVYLAPTMRSHFRREFRAIR